MTVIVSTYTTTGGSGTVDIAHGTNRRVEIFAYREQDFMAARQLGGQVQLGGVTLASSVVYRVVGQPHHFERYSLSGADINGLSGPQPYDLPSGWAYLFIVMAGVGEATLPVGDFTGTSSTVVSAGPISVTNQGLVIGVGAVNDVSETFSGFTHDLTPFFDDDVNNTKLVGASTLFTYTGTGETLHAVSSSSDANKSYVVVSYEPLPTTYVGGIVLGAASDVELDGTTTLSLSSGTFSDASGLTATLTGPFGSFTGPLTNVDVSTGTGEFALPATLLESIGLPEHHNFSIYITEPSGDTTDPVDIEILSDSAARSSNLAPGAVLVSGNDIGSVWGDAGFNIGDCLYVKHVSGGDYDSEVSNWDIGVPVYDAETDFPVQVEVWRTAEDGTRLPGDNPNGSDTFTFSVPAEEPCLLYTSPSPRDATLSRMPSSA